MFALGGPVVEPVTITGENDVAAVAASAVAGYAAFGDSFQDSVEVRDISGGVIRTISKSEILALCPWMTLDGGPDGIGGAVLTPSGTQLFMLVHDDSTPSDGLGSDAILRWSQPGNTLSLFARADLFDRGDQFPHTSAVHDRAFLYVGNNNPSGQGVIRAYLANAAVASGTLMATWSLPGNAAVRGLAVDRESHTLFAASDGAIYRTALTNNFSTPPTWTLVTNITGVRGMAMADAYGGSAQRGLYVLRTSASATSSIEFIPTALALGGSGVPFFNYTSSQTMWHNIAARGDGKLVVGADEDAFLIRDDADTNLSFPAWQLDEFQQVLTFSRGLISPDGEPAGWVIDADTIPTQARFHPATPDGAAWVVFMLLTADEMLGDAQAQSQVRSILTRYGGLASDNIKPSRTFDGIFRHWIDPLTGAAKPGWDPEFATLSTMKIVAAAARAMQYYPDDPVIAKAASRIIFRTRNWDSYIRASDRALYFKGLAVGPDTNSGARPFHEGIIFVDQAAAYGGSSSQTALSFWLNRSGLPSASYLPGFPITSTANGAFESAFISVYPAILTPGYRASSGANGWQTQIRNVRWSNAAWTDDWGSRFATVFSAGTTRSDWGGYNADNLQNHPGDVSTFPSMMGLSALGDANPSVGAYHAYRRGARQLFRTGANMLYRRSDVDRTYSPNSAGLPDVCLGALGLAELMQPGLIDSVLSREMPRFEMCPTDLNGDSRVGLDDVYAVNASVSDLNGDSVADGADVVSQINWVRRWERRQLLAR
ncbi:MAG: hypothetical protein U0640_14345 [Phycisphaerales bacterium]